jgi:hypothetical protein
MVIYEKRRAFCDRRREAWMSHACDRNVVGKGMCPLKLKVGIKPKAVRQSADLLPLILFAECRDLPSV